MLSNSLKSIKTRNGELHDEYQYIQLIEDILKDG